MSTSGSLHYGYASDIGEFRGGVAIGSSSIGHKIPSIVHKQF
jgi:hypothetical protein